MAGDKTLQQDVLDELEFDPAVNAAHIGVTADAGVVTLSGHVASYAEKVAAEQAARRVKGVRAIAEEIEVRLPFEKKRADDEIAVRALHILDWDAAVPASTIAVKVEKGIITLSGEVEWQYQKAQAESLVRRLSGVVAVINQIRLHAPVSASDVKEKITKALHRNAEVDASAITVDVSGNKVVLAGKVHDWTERDTAARAAWSAKGVLDVVDHIKVEL